MKVLYGPGFGSHKAETYGVLFDAIRTAGHDPEFVPIPWDHDDVMDAWSGAWRDAYYPHDPRITVLGAFSAGNVSLLHMVSQLPADQQPRGILFCSLSSFFKEDRLWERRASIETFWGPKVTPVLKELSFTALASNMTCPAELIAGTEEPIWLLERAADAERQLAHATLTTVPGVTHGEAIDHPDYIAAVVDRLQVLAAG